MVRLVSIEGNIGVGKSTVLAEIGRRFPTVHLFYEPLECWQKMPYVLGSKVAFDVLDLFYNEKSILQISRILSFLHIREV